MAIPYDTNSACYVFPWKNLDTYFAWVVPSAEDCRQEPPYLVPGANLCDTPNPIFPGLPGQPTNVVAHNITSTSFDCSWTPAVGATSYKATWLSNGITVSGTTYTASFTGLPPSTLGNLIILAININGTTASNPIPVNTLTAVPVAPLGFKWTRTSTNQINIGWNGSATATGYKVEWGVWNGGMTLVDVGNVLTWNTGGTLASVQQYRFRVYAYNAGGSSPPTADLLVYTLGINYGTVQTPVVDLNASFNNPTGFFQQVVQNVPFPADFDPLTNNQFVVSPQFIRLNYNIDPNPGNNSGGLYALRMYGVIGGVQTTNFINEWAGYTPINGHGTDPLWNGSAYTGTLQSWNVYGTLLAPGNSINVVFLIAYPAWHLHSGSFNVYFSYNQFKTN